MKRRHLVRALACASLPLIAALPSLASAQHISRIVAFGDSYTDTGNAFALGYANPQALQYIQLAGSRAEAITSIL